MSKNFQHVDDVLADSMFLDWYFKENDEQVKLWEQWLLQNPGQRELIDKAVTWMNHLQAREPKISTQETETRLEELRKRIATPVITMNNSRRRWWIGAAAAILILAGSLMILKWNVSKPTINTEFGQVASNQLPDGSTMILNANSTAKLSTGWEDGKDREVWLNGEAFFKVTKTARKSRFIVHTGNLDVIVTGTQFNVQHRDNKTAVLLTEGSVIIRTANGEELAMKPGDYIEMTANQVARKDGKPDNVLAWRDNMISFDNTPLTEVARIIQNHYGVTVKFADDSVATNSINGLMSNNNLDDLLKAIELVTDVRITRNNKEILFSTGN